MTREQLHEQACLHAVGALPADEARELEQALRHDSALRAEFESWRDASDSVALGIPQVPPPPGLKQKIFAQLDAAPPLAILPALEPLAPRRVIPLWMPLAAAAAIVLLGIIMVGNRETAREESRQLSAKIEALEENAAKLVEQSRIVDKQSGQIQILQQQLQNATERTLALSTQSVALQSQLRQAEALKRDLDAMNQRANQLSKDSDLLRSQLAELQSAQRVSLMQITLLKSLLEGSPDSAGVSVWDKEHQKGIFVADKLPPLPDDKTYQLWILDPKYTTPVSAGVFAVDDQGHARVEFTPVLPVDRSDRLAVSIERKGGVPQPEGRIVLLTQ
jgi:anti-sigma-K factor RskA